MAEIVADHHIEFGQRLPSGIHGVPPTLYSAEFLTHSAVRASSLKFDAAERHLNAIQKSGVNQLHWSKPLCHCAVLAADEKAVAANRRLRIALPPT
jgi:hypothetical protein